jgi:hypothetical protein
MIASSARVAQPTWLTLDPLGKLPNNDRAVLVTLLSLDVLSVSNCRADELWLSLPNSELSNSLSWLDDELLELAPAPLADCPSWLALMPLAWSV